MRVVIRPATQADLEGVLDLYADTGMDDGRRMASAEARRLLDAFGDYPSYRLYVACAPDGDGESDAPPCGEDAVVGSYALLVMHNLAHNGAPSAIAEDVVVSPRHQGQGIGRRMMEHALRQARDAGCYKLALSSSAQRFAAHAFYESLGFARHGISFAIET
ncbi:GNAT family N-acetyltransferase [Acidovorax sp. NCPPB 2350]|nr:GNAT family N-acetyltransferase [Acidovorax sp. NCPPB 2350]